MWTWGLLPLTHFLSLHTLLQWILGFHEMPFSLEASFWQSKVCPQGNNIYIDIYQLDSDATIFTPFIIYLDTHHAGYNGPFLFLMPLNYGMHTSPISLKLRKASEVSQSMFILATTTTTTTVSTWAKFDIDYMIFGNRWNFQKSVLIFTSIYFSRKTKESDGKFRNISLFCWNGILKIN
jgi:hypothetical protein